METENSQKILDVRIFLQEKFTELLNGLISEKGCSKVFQKYEHVEKKDNKEEKYTCYAMDFFLLMERALMDSNLNISIGEDVKVVDNVENRQKFISLTVFYNYPKIKQIANIKQNKMEVIMNHYYINVLYPIISRGKPNLPITYIESDNARIQRINNNTYSIVNMNYPFINTITRKHIIENEFNNDAKEKFLEIIKEQVNIFYQLIFQGIYPEYVVKNKKAMINYSTEYKFKTFEHGEV